MGTKIPAPRNMGGEVRTLAACDFTKQGVAQHFGVCVETLNRWMEENPEIAGCFAAGREDERQSLHNMLYKHAMEKGDTVAALFLLKTKHGYRENEPTGKGNRVAITFNLPGALKPDQYTIGTIDGDVIDGNARGSAKRLPDPLTISTGRV